MVTSVFTIPANQTVGSYTVTVTFAGNHSFSWSGFSITAAPAIQVLDGTTAIANGGSDSFGSTVAGTPVSKTFTVSNGGSASLTLTPPISVPSGFTVTSSFGTTTVAAGNSTTFTVQLNATATGSYSGTLSFANNVSGQTPYTFTISGTVVPAPAPVVVMLDGETTVAYSTGSVDFGETPQGAAFSKTFVVENTGTANLTLGTPISVPTASASPQASAQPRSPAATRPVSRCR